MKNWKARSSILLVLFFLLVACYNNYEKPIAEGGFSGDLVISRQLMDKFRIQANELLQLQVFLNQELLIKRLRPETQATIPNKNNSLKLEENERYEFVTFPVRTKGQIVNVDTIRTGPLSPYFGPIELRVTVLFERTGAKLRFITTQSTGFELETARKGNFVFFDDKRYQCVYGCGGNSLIVEANYFYKFYDIPSRVKGNPI